MKTNPLQIYIHIPFCVAKCAYCDFLSAPATETVRETYVEALCQEIVGRREEFCGRPITGIFIGGGTPSCLSGGQIERILQVLKQEAYIDPQAEITIEMNPGTVDREKLYAYKRSGINRLSIGLQSADNRELRLLGRIHTAEDFEHCYRMVREMGFTNVNVDLISAIPGQNADDFQRSLSYVQKLQNPPEHISVYSLIVEEGTPFYEMYGKRGELFLSDEEDREIYHQTKESMELAGYERYEISNYAKKGFACRHNVGYWTGVEYLGFGIGAASYMNQKRFANQSDLSAYLKAPLEQRFLQESLSVRDMMSEFFILGLRMIKGVSIKEFRKRFDVDADDVFGVQIEKGIRDGLLKRAGEYISLTEYGLDVCNVIFEQFLPD